MIFLLKFLISHDGNTVIMGNIDYYGEHILLLKNTGLKKEKNNTATFLSDGIIKIYNFQFSKKLILF